MIRYNAWMIYIISLFSCDYLCSAITFIISLPFLRILNHLLILSDFYFFFSVLAYKQGAGRTTCIALLWLHYWDDHKVAHLCPIWWRKLVINKWIEQNESKSKMQKLFLFCYIALHEDFDIICWTYIYVHA